MVIFFLAGFLLHIVEGNTRVSALSKSMKLQEETRSEDVFF